MSVNMPSVRTDHYKGEEYLAADLNRVETASAYVAGRLRGAGYFFGESLTHKRDWSKEDVQPQASMARYLGNVQKCRGALGSSIPAVLPVSMRYLDHAGANNIERCLGDIDALLDDIVAAYVECGVYETGEA